MSQQKYIPTSGSPIADGGKYQSGHSAPTDYSDIMPTHIDLLGQGGLMSGNIAYRNRLCAEFSTVGQSRLKEGQLYVITEHTDLEYGNIYQFNLSNHPTNPGADMDMANIDNRVLVGIGGGPSLLSTTDPFILTSADITNGYVDLTHTPVLTEHITLYYDGLSEGPATGTNPSDGMRTLTGNRITFNDADNDLYVGARIEVCYSY